MDTSSILAKVRVVSVSENKPLFGGEKEAETVIMEPVSADSPENKTFSDATPSGRIELVITNKSAWGFFVENAEHTVQFNPA